jgi:hypothetical protein
VKRKCRRFRGSTNAPESTLDPYDSLIQDMQGFILVIQGLAGELSKIDPLRRRVEAVLDHAEHALAEARRHGSNLSGHPFDLAPGPPNGSAPSILIRPRQFKLRKLQP